MATLCELALAAVGLLTVIVVGSAWLLGHLNDEAKDVRKAVRRITNAAHDAHVRIAREELRQLVEDLERTHLPQPPSRTPGGARS